VLTSNGLLYRMVQVEGLDLVIARVPNMLLHSEDES
jgi:hypothetical protein